MIRGSGAELKRRWGASAGHTVLLAVALAVPVWVMWTGFALQGAAAQWLSAYRPAIYVAPDADDGVVDGLRGEIEGWPKVE